jgi:signal peptidase I
MSDLADDADAQRPSPLTSFWLSPRPTIERIVAERPGYMLGPLIVIGGAAAAVANMMTANGAGSEIFDWRNLLGCLVAGSISAAFVIHVIAAFTGWIARKMGGAASNDAVRAVFAWGLMPIILGFAVALTIAFGWRLLAGGAEPLWLSTFFDVVNGVCGLWALVVTLMMLSRVERFGFWRTIAVYAISWLISAGLVPLVRTFLFQPFILVGPSMGPTLLPGDCVFVEKYPYGYSRYSVPLSPPLFSGRIFGSVPARGDVIAFRYHDSDYIERVAGLPGDLIQMREGELYINDMKVQRERMPDLAGDFCEEAGTAKRWRETMPNGASYETLDCGNVSEYDNTGVYTVPADHLFVLGDNRDNSLDSRFLASFGYVPIENVIGRVSMIFFSRDADDNGAWRRIRYERIGTLVR